MLQDAAPPHFTEHLIFKLNDKKVYRLISESKVIYNKAKYYVIK